MVELKEKREKERNGPSLLEWMAAAIGALLVIGILTFIAMDAIASKESGPPILEVTPVAIASSGRSHVVELEVTNRSGHAAAAVEIQGELRQGGQTVETSNATLNYLPGHSQRRAGLIFSRDPRRHALDLRATGYEVP
ncbi:TIGR02588 family protein [Sphingomonas sp.]|uniref:TIGR02588 family protein n=1 Tax=Sphingomonas sp. TaxID=28214 RepID=UPI00178EA3ED|nr:TIGR02588 family protein [Sphingomonas sp.]MBA3511283.1 TIGR02588 family protein [Sphingomonas sp.]